MPTITSLKKRMQEIREARYRGFCEGVILFAVWKNGTQLVGITREPMHELLAEYAESYRVDPERALRLSRNAQATIYHLSTDGKLEDIK